MATFRKNKSNEWVVFGTVSEVRPGKVRVTKKDGRTQTVEVASVGRPFYADGQQMVYGYIAPKSVVPAPKPVSAPVSAPVSLVDDRHLDLDDSLQAEMAWEARMEQASEDAALEKANEFLGF